MRRPAPITSLDIEITRRCNLNCAYCYLKSNGDDGAISKGADMPPSTIAAAVGCLARLGAKRPQGASRWKPPHVTFYGGEPMLNPVGMALAQEAARSAGVEATWSALSNGTIGSERMASWLKARGIALQRSLDGAPGTMDRCRERSLARYLELDDVYPDDRKKTRRCTIQPEAAGTLLQSLRWFAERGYRKGASFMPNFYPAWSDGQVADFERSIRDISREMEEDYLAGKRPLVYDFWLARAARAVFSDRPQNARGVYGCGAGKGMHCATVDGTLVPCHRFATHEEHAKHGTLGGMLADVAAGRSGIEYSGEFEAFRSEQVSGWSPEECRTCEARFGCSGLCQHVSLIVHGRFGAVDPRWCRWMLVAVEEVRRLDGVLGKVDPQWHLPLMNTNKGGANGQRRKTDAGDVPGTGGGSVARPVPGSPVAP